MAVSDYRDPVYQSWNFIDEELLSESLIVDMVNCWPSWERSNAMNGHKTEWCRDETLGIFSVASLNKLMQFGSVTHPWISECLVFSPLKVKFLFCMSRLDSCCPLWITCTFSMQGEDTKCRFHSLFEEDTDHVLWSCRVRCTGFQIPASPGHQLTTPWDENFLRAPIKQQGGVLVLFYATLWGLWKWGIIEHSWEEGGLLISRRYAYNPNRIM